MASATDSNTTAQKTNNTVKGKELTPEQVRLVAEKVYAMFLRDMKLARERTGRGYTASRAHRATSYR